MLSKVLVFFKQQAVIYCLLFLLLVNQPLWAAVEPGISTTSELAIQVFLGLMLVLSLMFALAWLAKRMRLVPGNVGGQNTIRTLAVLPLSNREKLLLVQVGEEQLLLGVTNQQITCLHELKKPIDFNVTKPKPAFAQFMQQWSAKNQLTATKTEEKKVDEAD
ncbi:MAG: flagellar biosynthetic protein FliO [Pseudomonadaceae bacterium]|nr:flagellar biosynthetic protein FliO [Pseudomonadaceae bacterium]